MYEHEACVCSIFEHTKSEKIVIGHLSVIHALQSQEFRCPKQNNVYIPEFVLPGLLKKNGLTPLHIIPFNENLIYTYNYLK